MQIRIQAGNDPMAEKAEKVLHYYLPELDERLQDIEIRVAPVRDALDTPLFRCAVQATLLHGDELAIEETQADLVLTITRALDRTVRTLRRRQATRQLRRSA
jgi:hypothetical protein